MQGTSDPNRELLDAAALVGHLVLAGSVYAFLAEHRHRLFPDELFADLFGSGRGRPSVPTRSPRVMVLQSLEGLSDRDALQALRTRTSVSWTSGPPSAAGPTTFINATSNEASRVAVYVRLPPGLGASVLAASVLGAAALAVVESLTVSSSLPQPTRATAKITAPRVPTGSFLNAYDCPLLLFVEPIWAE